MGSADDGTAWARRLAGTPSSSCRCLSTSSTRAEVSKASACTSSGVAPASSDTSADGVSAEVLYATHGLKCLSIGDHELEAACARVYNDWLIDYCSAAPDRLIGIAMLSMYDIPEAVKEMEREPEAEPADAEAKA